MVTIVQPKLPRVKFYPNKPGEAYRPCNGTEGEYFWSMWCEECARDKAMNGTCHREGREPDEEDYCEILGRSFRTDEPLPEWTYGEDGQPRCTQFVRYIEPREDEQLSQVVRDDRTIDMFGDEQPPAVAAEAGDLMNKKTAAQP